MRYPFDCRLKFDVDFTKNLALLFIGHIFVNTSQGTQNSSTYNTKKKTRLRTVYLNNAALIGKCSINKKAKSMTN